MVQREWVEKDFYKVLGVSSDAKDDEIKKVARKLLAENHPDRNPIDVAAEERYLQRQFGEGYRAYCESVPRWIPRARGLIETVRSFGFDWRRVVAKEYPTMTTTVLCACAIIAARS